MKSTQPVEVIVTVPAGVDIDKVLIAMQLVEEEAFASGELSYNEAIAVATGIIQQIKERIVT